MVTPKKRFTIAVDDDTLDSIEYYRFINHLTTRSKACDELIRKGIETFEQEKQAESDKTGTR